MKKCILVFFCFLILCSTEIFAGSPWGEVLPKGLSWLKLYYIGTWTSEKFDENREKEPLVSGVKSNGRQKVKAVEYAYGLTDNLTVGAIIPYTFCSLKLEPEIIPKQEGTGIGDVKVGTQYRYHKTDILSLSIRSKPT